MTLASLPASLLVPFAVQVAEAQSAASFWAPYSAVNLMSAPFKAGDRIFSADSSGALYVRESASAPLRLLLNARTYSLVAPSPDGKRLAYESAAAGSRFGDVHVIDVTTGRLLPDVLHAATISGAPWTHNNKGFFYERRDASGDRERVYYHSIGRTEDRDGVVLSVMDHPDWRYDTRVSDDGHYAVFTISYSADRNTRIYFIDLDEPNKPNLSAPVVKLVDTFSARYEFVDNAGSYFILQTDRDAPRGRVVVANTDLTVASRWPSLIPESGDSLLYARTAGEQYVLAVYHSGKFDLARIFGPPDPSVLRSEMRQRMDSLRKVERNDPNRPRADRSSLEFRSPQPVRVELRADLPIPQGSSIVALNSIADDNVVYYTVRMPDGTLRSYSYDVKNGHQTAYAYAAQGR